MRDDQHGAVPGQPVKRLLHKVFRFGVGERGGLVEDQDRGVGQDGAGDGQPLPFPAGEPGAGAQHGVVAVRQTQDAVVDLRFAGRGLDLLDGGIGDGQRDVLRDGAVHQLGLLQDETDLRVQLVGGQRPNVLSPNAYRALLDVVESGQQRGEGGLAGAGRSDQRGDRAGPKLSATRRGSPGRRAGSRS